MVLKYKSNTIYYLVITILIIILLLILYLGNYNLIEGNTILGTEMKLNSLLENNQNISNGLKAVIPYKNVCPPMDQLNIKNATSIHREGGVNETSQRTHNINQLLATTCSNNKH